MSVTYQLAVRVACPVTPQCSYKHGSVADYLIFACILLQGSRMYRKAPRRYQIKAENAKIGMVDVPIERNPVMEVPALVFAARRGIDVLDW